MKAGILILLVVGLASGKSPLSVMDKVEKVNRKEFLHQGPEYLEQAMDDLWKQYTNEDLEPPTFFSDTYDRNIIGKNMESYYGRPIYAFQGIQYGKPPTAENNLRFRPSQPSTKYEEMDPSEPIMADHLGFKCPQKAMIGNQPAGNEDCLYLNVYTPYLPGSNKSEPLPVMFFIYGGGFIMGDSSLYMPTKLLEHDVILVTIHYRLGAFGFFNMENIYAPGDSALYDMINALKWVNKYIADFGGDPGKVTVQGQSAGAVSASYMLVIPQAKDLIHGVISESGSTLDVWAVDENPRFATEYVAKSVGCPIEYDSDMYECVAKASMDDLVIAQDTLVSEDRQNGLMGFRGAAPSVQKYDGDLWEVLVSKHPRESYENGEVNPVPLLQGTNKQEGSFVVGISYYAYLLPTGLVDNELYMRNQMTTDILASFGVGDSSHAMSFTFDEYFCSGVDMGTFEAAAPCMNDMTGVMFLKGSGWECANLHSFYTNKSTYYYSFDFMSDDTMYTWMLGAPPPGLDPGVTHADEMMYIFSMPAIMEGMQIDIMKRMTLLWTNFATYGDPTPDENSQAWQDLSIPKWPSFNTDNHHYMLMRDDFTAELEFPNRWTITMDELSSPPGVNTTATPDPTDPCNGPTQAEYDALQDKYDELDSKSTAYLVCMIIFLILFVIAGAYIGYMYKKNRGPK